jgi:ABC-type antimicrobial peptide transport system permease subunit
MPRRTIRIFLGLVASLALARMIENQLWGVSSTDPVTLTAVIAIVAACGLTTSYIPARRATRVSPIVALRADWF